VLERRNLSTAPVDEVSAALDLLAAHGPLSRGAEIAVDLSLARGLRYYTGLVFEIYVDSDDGPLQVCGGGRYDDLVRALGGRESVPACGFSYGLERVDLARPDAPPTMERPRVLVVGVTPGDHAAALAIAQQLRGIGGITVEQDVRLRGVKAALRHADRISADVVAIVGERERLEDQVVVRNMRKRQESRVARGDVVPQVREALEA
jgi:histidyl-tRNA synthetase